MQKNISSFSKAFTMLELVFVITILGIISSIGAEIVAQTYQSYLVQRAASRSSVKTEIAATAIINRLTYAIPGTIIGRKGDTYRAVEQLDANDYTILQWVGADNDSFTAYRKPSWSGLADLDASDATHVISPGSDIDNTDEIIQNLQGDGLSDAALFFQGEYTAYNIGYNGEDNSGVIAVTGGTDETINVSDMTGNTISELYKLGWSSYAIVPEENDNGSYDLMLHYNFQPWKGETYNDGNIQLLLKNVSVFQFTATATTLRIKICQQEQIGDGFITTCKEKAVIK